MTKFAVEFGVAQLRHQYWLLGLGCQLDPGLISHGIISLEQTQNNKFWPALAELRRLYMTAIGKENWSVMDRLSRTIQHIEQEMFPKTTREVQ